MSDPIDTDRIRLAVAGHRRADAVQYVERLCDEIDRLRAIDVTSVAPEYVARCFHSHYERLAPDFRYATRAESAVPWAQVPEANRNLMIAVAGHVLRDIQDVLGRAAVSPKDGEQ